MKGGGKMEKVEFKINGKTVFGKNKATQQEIQQNQIRDPAKDLHEFGIRGKHRGLLKIRCVPYFIMEE